jgi:ABC-type molybdate transport system substrate-binding protein
LDHCREELEHAMSNTLFVRRLSFLLLFPLSAAHAQLSGPAMEQKLTDAKPGDVRILATAAIMAPLEAVRKQAEAAVGKRLVIEYGSARGNLKDMLMAGQSCDVTLLLPDVDQALVKAGKMDATQKRVASVPVALGVAGNPPKLDVSTKEGIKTALVNAKAVRYAPTGAAHDTVDRILDTLDIRNTIKDVSREKMSQQGGAASPQWSAGQYEMDIFPLSEILVNKSLTNLGTVIPELQVPAVIEASTCKAPAERAAAQAFIKFLQGPVLEPALKASGMAR